MKRRHFAAVTLASAGGGTLTKMYTPAHVFARDQRLQRSRVAVLSAESYSDKLDDANRTRDPMERFRKMAEAEPPLLDSGAVSPIWVTSTDWVKKP